MITQEFSPGLDKESKSNWLIVFDRDNTLNHDFGYTHKVEDFSWKSGVPELLALLAPLQLNFAIASNQSGIGKGLYSIEDAKTFNSHLVAKAKEFGVSFSVVVFCPHDPELDFPCDCRKPNSGMLIFLGKYFSTDLKMMIFIGDSNIDRLAAAGAGSIFLDINETCLFQSIKKLIDQ